MTGKEKSITRFLRSRGMTFISAVAACVMIAGKWGTNDSSLLAVVFLVLATAFIMVDVNRRYNLLRSLSVYFAGLFLIMMGTVASMPTECTIALAAPFLLMELMVLLFECYDSPSSTKPIFLIFCLLSGAGFLNQGFLYYVPIFMVGMAQMKCSKGWLPWTAACIGLGVPWWLAWAFAPQGWIPSLHWYLIPWGANWLHNIAVLPGHVLAVSLFTLGLLLVIWLMNIIKIMAYNAHARAFNGLLSSLTVGTWLWAIIDFPHIVFFLPTLMCMTAFQMGHFFRIYLSRRAYILAILVLGAYVALYFVS